jgi:predicted ATPase
MDIIHGVYIHRYRHVSQAYISFGTNITCAYERECNSISISKRDLDTSWMFGPSFSGFGAIIGKNGSGKTSIIELLACCIGTQGKSDSVPSGVRGFVIWSDSPGSVRATGPWLLEPQDRNEIQPELIPRITFNNNEVVIDRERWPEINVFLFSSLGAFKSPRTINLAPYNNNAWVFDGRNDAFIARDFERECDSDDQHPKSSPLDQLSIYKKAHATQEVMRQLEFMEKMAGRSEANTILPDVFHADLIGLSPRTLVPSMLRARGAMPPELNEVANSGNPSSAAGNLARVLCWTLAFEGTYSTDTEKRAKAVLDLWPRLPRSKGEASSEAYYRECLGILFDKLHMNSHAKVREKAKLWDILTGRPDLVSFSGFAMPRESFKLSQDQESFGYYWFSSPSRTHDGKSKNIIEAMSIYKKAHHLVPYLDIEYASARDGIITPYTLSHGESDFISMFGRVLFAEKTMEKESINIRTTLVFLDEIDVPFHPEWQRRLVYSLSELLPLVVTAKSIQVLLSTHAPLVLSDMPHDLCTKLSTNNAVPKVSTSISDDRETFAANIYDLLHDEFFLESGFIGELATKKLLNIRDDMLGNVINRSEAIAKCRPLVNRISDPILKSGFQRLISGERNDLDGNP